LERIIEDGFKNLISTNNRIGMWRIKMLEKKVLGSMYALLLTIGIFSYAALITASNYVTYDTLSRAR